MALTARGAAPPATDRPRPALLPRLAPPPGGRLLAVLVLVALSALLVLGAHPLPGDGFAGDPLSASFAETLHRRWLLTRLDPLASMHSRLLGFPASIDVLSLQGPPLDALLAAAFIHLLGWTLGNDCYSVAVLASLGLAVARLSGRWWRSAPAALLAGSAAVASGSAGLALAEGRTSQVLAIACLILALERFVTALVLERWQPAAVAGLCAGIGALACWSVWPLLLFSVGLLVLLAWLDGRRPQLPLAAACALACAVAALPLVYLVAYDHLSLPQNLSGFTWSLEGGRALLVIDDLHRSALDPSDLAHRWPLRPLLCALALGGLLRERPRRWLVPAVLLALALVLALGPVLVLPGGTVLQLPGILLLQLPSTRAVWPPEHALLLAGPALALLAGGGAAAVASRHRHVWVAPLLVALVLGEAVVQREGLPVQRLTWLPTERAEILARSRGPALLLPAPGGYLEPGSQALIDQLFHQRPLANWMRHPDHALTPSAFATLVADSTLGALFACERDPEADDVRLSRRWRAR